MDSAFAFHIDANGPEIDFNTFFAGVCIILSPEKYLPQAFH